MVAGIVEFLVSDDPVALGGLLASTGADTGTSARTSSAEAPCAIDPESGVYSAPPEPSLDIVRVMDAEGSTSEAQIVVVY
jgi:hypothetical protein